MRKFDVEDKSVYEKKLVIQLYAKFRELLVLKYLDAMLLKKTDNNIFNEKNVFLQERMKEITVNYPEL